MLTTAGMTLATASTVGSDAGSTGDAEGVGTGGCADSTVANKMSPVVAGNQKRVIGQQVTNRPLHCQLAGRGDRAEI